MRKQLLNRKFVSVLVLWMAMLGMAPTHAFALPSQSLSALQSDYSRNAQIGQIMSVLSRPEAQLRLQMLGVSQKEMKDMLSKLDDGQLNQVADKAETIEAGGGAIGLVIGILLIVLLVVVIMSVSNKKIVVKDA